VLSNVLDFEVLVDWAPNTGGLTSSSVAPQPFKQNGSAYNTDFPYDYLSIQGQGSLAGQGIFDTWYDVGNTWSSNPAPMAIRVKSIQVTLRVWDGRIKLARQNTWRFFM